jgi:uncharacterized protein
MSLPAELLEILRCPACKGPLTLVSTETESLDCRVCRRRFAIRDGIPIMLLDQSSTL